MEHWDVAGPQILSLFCGIQKLRVALGDGGSGDDDGTQIVMLFCGILRTPCLFECVWKNTGTQILTLFSVFKGRRIALCDREMMLEPRA